MRILITTPAYVPSSFGGIKNYATVLSRQFVIMGHDVTVYTSNSYDHHKNMDIHGVRDVNGVRVVYLTNRVPRRYWHTPGVLPQILREKDTFDVVHLNNNFSYMNSILYHVARWRHIPFVFSAHGSLTARFRNVLPKKAYNRLVTSSILRHAGGLIALNEHERQQYLDMGADPLRVEVIPLGICTDDFQAPSADSSLAAYGVTEEDSVLTFVGRLHPIKGLEYAIEAVDRLVRSGHRVKFLIVGHRAGCYEQLRRIVDNLNLNRHVIFTGPLYGLDKTDVLHHSDVFVLPSRSDMFPTATLEAGCCGLPLVLSEGVMLCEQIKREAAVVSALNAESLAEAIGMLLKDETSRQQLGARARDIVSTHYTIEAMSRKTIQLYESIINREGHIRAECAVR